MPYFVYGNNAQTGEPVKRLYSDAPSEDMARAQGAAHGMQVTAVVACNSEQRLVPSASSSAGNGTGADKSIGRPHATMPGAVLTVASGIARYALVTGISTLGLAALFVVIAILSHRIATSVAINIVALLITATLTLNVANKFRGMLRARDDDAIVLTRALGSVRILYMFQAVAMCLACASIVLLLLRAVL